MAAKEINIRNTDLILGIDDSGRGPVIGPMVLAGVVLKKSVELKLKQIGIKDSKLLSPKRRSFLANIIKKTAKAHYIIKIEPKEIDSRAENGLNLNKIEAIKSADIINKLAKKSKIKKVIIDCPSTNIIRWKEYLMPYINKKIYVICEHKADLNHIACSAASILAKVTRDKEIDSIQAKIPEAIGSGYPSDPITKKFLHSADKYKKLRILRETWQTWKNHKKDNEQKKINDF